MLLPDFVREIWHVFVDISVIKDIHNSSLQKIVDLNTVFFVSVCLVQFAFFNFCSLSFVLFVVFCCSLLFFIWINVNEICFRRSVIPSQQGERNNLLECIFWDQPDSWPFLSLGQSAKQTDHAGQIKFWGCGEMLFSDWHRTDFDTSLAKIESWPYLAFHDHFHWKKVGTLSVKMFLSITSELFVVFLFRKNLWQTFIIVSVAIWVVAFPVNFFVLWICEMPTESKEMHWPFLTFLFAVYFWFVQWHFQGETSATLKFIMNLVFTQHTRHTCANCTQKHMDISDTYGSNHIPLHSPVQSVASTERFCPADVGNRLSVSTHFLPKTRKKSSAPCTVNEKWAWLVYI